MSTARKRPLHRSSSASPLLVRDVSVEEKQLSRRSPRHQGSGSRNSNEDEDHRPHNRKAAVLVAVRIRPLNDTEVSSEQNELFQTQGARVLHEVNPAARSAKLLQSWAFDHVYSPSAPTSDVYRHMCRPLLLQALSGYNGAMLAYGQTAAGKTHTLLGTPECPGVARLLVATLERALQTAGTGKQSGQSRSEDERDHDNFEYIIRMSCVELYQTELRDLLAPTTASSGSSTSPPTVSAALDHGTITGNRLRIAEDPVTGAFVVGAQEETILAPDHILEHLHVAEKARHVAPTERNQHSSRSHMIVRLNIHIRERTAKAKAGRDTWGDETGRTASSQLCQEWMPPLRPTRVSVLQLVDLAGSERTGQIGASGIRRREGTMINQSLLALGNVIAALTAPTTGTPMTATYHQGQEQGQGGVGARSAATTPTNMDASISSRLPFIPYRDSKLTRLLSTAFGGNAQTALICCISPSTACRDESLQTLRFASRAQRVINTVHRNDVQQLTGLLGQYKSEIDRLRSELVRAQSSMQMQKALEEQNHELHHALATHVEHSAAIAQNFEQHRAFMLIAQKLGQDIRQAGWLDVAKQAKKTVQSVLRGETPVEVAVDQLASTLGHQRFSEDRNIRRGLERLRAVCNSDAFAEPLEEGRGTGGGRSRSGRHLSRSSSSAALMNYGGSTPLSNLTRRRRLRRLATIAGEGTLGLKAGPQSGTAGTRAKSQAGEPEQDPQHNHPPQQSQHGNGTSIQPTQQTRRDSPNNTSVNDNNEDADEDLEENRPPSVASTLGASSIGPGGRVLGSSQNRRRSTEPIIPSMDDAGLVLQHQAALDQPDNSDDDEHSDGSNTDVDDAAPTSAEPALATSAAHPNRVSAELATPGSGIILLSSPPGTVAAKGEQEQWMTPHAVETPYRGRGAVRPLAEEPTGVSENHQSVLLLAEHDLRPHPTPRQYSPKPHPTPSHPHHHLGHQSSPRQHHQHSHHRRSVSGNSIDPELISDENTDNTSLSSTGGGVGSPSPRIQSVRDVPDLNSSRDAERDSALGMPYSVRSSIGPGVAGASTVTSHLSELDDDRDDRSSASGNSWCTEDDVYELHRQLDTRAMEYEDTRAALWRKDLQYEEQRTLSSQVDARNSELAHAIVELQTELEAANNAAATAIKATEAANKATETGAAEHKAVVDDLSKQADSRQRELEESQRLVECLRQTLAEWQDRNTELERTISDSEGRIASLKHKYDELARAESETNERSATLATQNQELQQRVAQLEADVAKRASVIGTLEEELYAKGVQLEERQAAHASECDELQHTATTQAERIVRLDAALKESEEEVERLIRSGRDTAEHARDLETSVAETEEQVRRAEAQLVSERAAWSAREQELKSKADEEQLVARRLAAQCTVLEEKGETEARRGREATTALEQQLQIAQTENARIVNEVREELAEAVATRDTVTTQLALERNALKALHTKHSNYVSVTESEIRKLRADTNTMRQELVELGNTMAHLARSTIEDTNAIRQECFAQIEFQQSMTADHSTTHNRLLAELTEQAAVASSASEELARATTEHRALQHAHQMLQSDFHAVQQRLERAESNRKYLENQLAVAREEAADANSFLQEEREQHARSLCEVELLREQQHAARVGTPLRRHRATSPDRSATRPPRMARAMAEPPQSPQRDNTDGCITPNSSKSSSSSRSGSKRRRRMSKDTTPSKEETKAVVGSAGVETLVPGAPSDGLAASYLLASQSDGNSNGEGNGDRDSNGDTGHPDVLSHNVGGEGPILSAAVPFAELEGAELATATTSGHQDGGKDRDASPTVMIRASQLSLMQLERGQQDKVAQAHIAALEEALELSRQKTTKYFDQLLQQQSASTLLEAEMLALQEELQETKDAQATQLKELEALRLQVRLHVR